jgi:YVTN family beta-propeller protein
VIDRRSFLAGGLALAAACRPRRGAGFPGYAFVANEEGQAVAVVDLTAFAVARHIPLGANPTEVIAHPSRPSVFALTPRTGAVHEIDAGALALGRKRVCANAALSMRLAPDARSLWVLAREPRQLIRLGAASLQVEARMPLAGEPKDFDIARDGARAAVSFGREGWLAILNLETGKTEHVLSLGKALGAVRFQSNGRNLLAANLEDRMLTIVHVESGRVVTHLPLAVRPDNLCFNSDAGQLFITGDGMDAVVIVYPYQTEVAETVLAGHAPGAMAAAPGLLFVANPRSNRVTILDIETHKAIAAAPAGAEPGHITITPDNQYALVLNRRSGDMAVIRIAAIIATRSKSAPLFTMIPVGSKPVSAAVRGV